MRKSHVLALFGLLAGVAIGVVWFALSDSGEEGVVDIAPFEVNASEPGDDSRAELNRPTENRSSEPLASTAQLAEERRTEAQRGALADVPEDQLRWIEGRLVLPEGAIWDDTAMALSVATPERKRASRALFRMISREDQVPTAETEVLYRTKFNSDGTFKVACAKDAEWAYLEIDAQFLYLAEPQAVKLEGPVTHVDLAPLLGSSLKGTWVVGEDANAVEREFTGGMVYLTTISNTNMPAIFDMSADDGVPAFHRTWVAADGTFELRGVDPTVDWILVSHPPRLASAISDEIELVPGEEAELEVDLVRGSHISGTVENQSGKPLLGARVFVTNSDDDVGYERMKLVARESLSRGDGSFDIFGVAPGELRVHAELAGYRKPIRKKLELEPGGEETGLVFKMRRGRALRGTVVWGDGTKAEGAILEVGRDATGKTGGIDANLRTRYGTAEADVAGQFEVVGLKRRASSIWAWASRESGGRWVEGVARMDGVKASEEEEIQLVLRENPLLTGFVRDEEGNPVQNFELQIRTDDGAGSMMTVWMRKDQESERSFNSPDGSFRIERLDVGDYTVTAIAEGFASSTPLGFRLPIGFDTPPLEIELFGFSGVTGVVVDPRGAPVPGAEVSLSMDSEESVDMLLAEVQAPVSVRTNGRGEFALNQLQPGEISLVAASSEWVGSEKTKLDLLPGELRSGVTIALRAGASMTVEVLDPTGKPADEYNVVVAGERQGPRPFGNRSRSASQVDSNGWVEFNGLVPGEVTVTAYPLNPDGQLEALGYLGEEFSDMNTSSRQRISAELELFDGETAHLVLGGIVEGLGDPVAVTGEVTLRGDPVSAFVTYTPRQSSLAAKTKRAQTDAQGRYKLELEFPGDYTVVVDPLGDDTARGSLSVFRRVRPVEAMVFDFSIPAGRISGTIFNPDREPAGEVPVTLRRIGLPSTHSSGRNWFPGQFQTDSDGNYEFDGLEPGSYIVGAGSSMIALFLGGAAGFGRTLSDTVRLEEDEDRRVDIQLGASCEIRGDVVDRDGKPVNGATIFAFDASGVPVDGLSSTTSNASGRFIYEGVAEGHYSFMARTKDQVSPLSKPVRVDENEGDRITLTIDEGVLLVIELLDRDGELLPAKVGVADDRGRSMNDLRSFGGALSAMNMGNPDELRSRVGPVAAGAYRVTAKADGLPEQVKDVIVRGGEEELRVTLQVEE